ncbi:MAG TPA: hypothetical protein VMT29_06505 [Steroidobacteraceae bacterium]|nr:hypothetical protein [Steroidobacteraceae bacterium]
MYGSTRARFVRMFGSAVAIQALLSATNFFIGIVLIRHTADLQYGYYVLITNAMLLISGLQSAFVQPPLVLRMTTLDPAGRATLVGGLYHGQRILLRRAAAALSGVTLLLWLFHVIEPEQVFLNFAAIIALVCILYKESFRMVLLAHRRSYDVLKADGCYVLIVVVTVPLATLTPMPAAFAVLLIAAATCVSGVMMSRFLWRFEPWDRKSRQPVLTELAPMGGWSAAGSATHWAFSQGYSYVVAAVLDVPSVAALAAIRLLMMPINLLSSGITSLMMPTASAWLQQHGAVALFRRLWAIAAGLAALALCYFGALWFTRDALFAHLIRKSFAHRDGLMLAWFSVFLVMIFRDQLLYVLGATGRFRSLTSITLASALISLGTGYVAILHLGVLGAPLGVLIGELVNLAGIIVLSRRCINLAPAAQAAP